MTPAEVRNHPQHELHIRYALTTELCLHKVLGVCLFILLVSCPDTVLLAQIRTYLGLTE